METNEFRLGDVCKLRNGYAFKSENFTNEGVPVIRISNIKDNEATVAKTLKTNPSSVFDKFAVKKGDILIAMSGATTGKFGIYNSEEKAYQNQRVGCFVITDEEKLSNDYLYLLLNGLKRKIESDAYGGGQPNISSSIIENYNVNLPSLAEQAKIVSVLNRAEELVKQRKKSILYFEEFLKSTFLKMFGSLQRPKFETDEIEKYSLKITDGTHLGPKFISSGIPFLLVSNIVNNEINYNTKNFISENEYLELNKRTPIEKGDILITSVGSYGNPALVKTITKFAFQRHIAYIKPNNQKINNVYLFGALKSDFVKMQIEKVVRGAAQKTLNLAELRKLKIPIPPIELQTRFASIVTETETLKEQYQISLIELENLLGSLTQRAFRGDLNIVERIEISGSIKIKPKISAEVIAIDNMNKQLADFHNSIADSGAPNEIDNKLKQLDAELKLRGEIPFWDEYIKYRLIKEKQTTPFTFEKLWKEITAFPFESIPDYDTVKNMIFKLLNSDNPFLIQRFNESNKQIELLLNETTSA